MKQILAAAVAVTVVAVGVLIDPPEAHANSGCHSSIVQEGTGITYHLQSCSGSTG